MSIFAHEQEELKVGDRVTPRKELLFNNGKTPVNPKNPKP